MASHAEIEGTSLDEAVGAGCTAGLGRILALVGVLGEEHHDEAAPTGRTASATDRAISTTRAPSA